MVGKVKMQCSREDLHKDLRESINEWENTDLNTLMSSIQLYYNPFQGDALVDLFDIAAARRCIRE